MDLNTNEIGNSYFTDQLVETGNYYCETNYYYCETNYSLGFSYSYGKMQWNRQLFISRLLNYQIIFHIQLSACLPKYDPNMLRFKF